MKYYLTIGGRKYDFQRLEFTRSIGTKSQLAVLHLHIARGSIIPALNDVVTIEKEYLPAKNNIIKVIAYDYARKINYVQAKNLGYNNTKGSSIFSQEVAPPTTTDLTAGTIDTTDSIIDTVFFGKQFSTLTSKITRQNVFDIISMISDRDIYIKRDGIVDFLNGAGTDRSTTHILEHGVNGNLLEDVGYSEDEIRRVKQVIVKGHGVGSTFKLGTAGTPATSDKVRQFEMPFLQSNATCTSVATNILAELDQQYKFAKFALVDLFSTNYDIFDIVKLKARLPTKTINENLKIMKIQTVVSAGQDDVHELVTLDLSNFRRAVFASLSHPEDADTANVDLSLDLNAGITQSQQQLSAQSIQETFTSYGSPIEVDNSAWVDLATIGFGNAKTLGAYFIIDISILPTSKIDTTHSDPLFFRVSDGITTFPSTNVNTMYVPLVGKKQHKVITIYVPQNTENKSYTIQAITSNGRVDLGTFVTAYSVGM